MSISTVVSQLITIAKDDASKLMLPAAASFLTAMAANPTKVNLAIQLVILEGAILKALPTMETDELQALSQTLLAEVTAALASPQTAAASPTTSGAIAAAKPA